MAISKSRSDALGLYLTGAASDGGAQPSPEASFGNYRSSTEASILAGLIEDAIPPIVVERVLPIVGQGEAVIRGDHDGNVYLTPYGAGEGAAVAIADGETKLVEGTDRDEAVRVTRDGTGSIYGSMSLDLVEQLNAVVAGPNLANAERAAGADKYGALMLRPHGAYGVLDIDIWIATLGTQRVSDAAQLGAAGTGTIQTTGSLADWPEVGFCQIRQADGTLREIVHYSSRTATTLTISSADHRELLGTTAAAGAADDTMDAVPGIRIDLEDEDSDGKIQTIADEDTAPAAVSWNTSITQAAGLSIVTLDVSHNYGLWIHREFPAGGEEAIELRNVLNLVYWGADE